MYLVIPGRTACKSVHIYLGFRAMGFRVFQCSEDTFCVGDLCLEHGYAPPAIKLWQRFWPRVHESAELSAGCVGGAIFFHCQRCFDWSFIQDLKTISMNLPWQLSLRQNAVHCNEVSHGSQLAVFDFAI